MSAANRSDAFIGSDECDDVNGYDGKVPAFDWKLIRVRGPPCFPARRLSFRAG